MKTEKIGNSWLLRRGDVWDTNSLLLFLWTSSPKQWGISVGILPARPKTPMKREESKENMPHKRDGVQEKEILYISDFIYNPKYMLIDAAKILMVLYILFYHSP